MAAGKVEYKREFFDRDYTLKEAYGRVWKYARKYRLRLAVGVVCGMATAGTLVPFFQIVQPALHHVESHDAEVVREESPQAAETAAETSADAQASPEKSKKNAFERQIEKNSKLPSWYPKIEKFAAKCGIAIQTESGGMAGALLLIVLVVIPAVALVRLVLMYLNHYCLSWSGAHAVADIRQELFDHVERQGLEFFGRVDIGQVMTRMASDPQQIQIILSTVLSEVAMAPFEIFVSIGFIIWFAVTNHMLPTLCLILVGFPLFVIPVQALGKRVKKWARRSMERGSMVGSKIIEVMTCIKVVKSYNTEDMESRRYASTNNYFLKSTMRGLRISLMVGPSVETVGIFLICGFLVWCFVVDIRISDVVPMSAGLTNLSTLFTVKGERYESDPDPDGTRRFRPVEGREGTHYFAYRVIGPGVCGIAMEYKTSWEKKAPEKVFEIMIHATGTPEEAASDPAELPPEEEPVYMTDSKGNVTVRPDRL